MESFNKNWLAILLIAVVFGALGFLFGRMTAHPPRHERMMFMNEHGSKNFNPGDSVQIDVEVEDGALEEGTVILRMDSSEKAPKKIIIREIRKEKK